jgi:hypothetical protein
MNRRGTAEWPNLIAVMVIENNLNWDILSRNVIHVSALEGYIKPRLKQKIQGNWIVVCSLYGKEWSSIEAKEKNCPEIISRS